MPRIEAAAIRGPNGEIFTLPAPAPHRAILTRCIFKSPEIVDGEYGFLTSDQEFVGRVKAKQIAAEAGQLAPEASKLPQLFSEDLIW